ncbi:extracellular solute-binding protein [Microbacterium sp. NPDC057659]|uniref:extracellular solute-binding protein n=1 Tax=Microbacterium sp. NPDC057659 TaxID=3346198 RepID=UPI003673226C
MRRKYAMAIGAIAVAALLPLSACGSGSSSGSGSDKITVWVMQGEFTDETLAAINDRFEKETGAKVDVQAQTWDDITTKITTALAGSTPPDALDIGTTLVPTYAASGAIVDLSEYSDDLRQGQTWLAGLEEPATIDGKLYGVPAYAGARAVIYNKKMWAEAGITAAPTTYDELKKDLDALRAKNPDPNFSPLYLPGQSDFVGYQFIWDAGGEIATGKEGAWKGETSSPTSQAGLKEFQDFQNTYSAKGSRTLATDKPEQNQIFADGHAAAIIGIGAALTPIEKINPELNADNVGTFAMPGASGENQPVLLGGSDWSIASKSKNQELAREWIKIATSKDIAVDFIYGKDKWIPNSQEAIEAVKEKGLPEIQTGFFDAALRSRSTPPATRWAAFEGENATEQFFQTIAVGSKSIGDASKQFDARLEQVLNGK